MDLVKMHMDHFQCIFNIYIFLKKWSEPALKRFNQFFL